MKKSFIILASVVLAAVGCMKFEPEVPVDKVYVDSPAITVTQTTDVSFSAVITPVQGTGFYSYAVKKGKATAVDSMTVFKLGLSGSLLKGTANFAETPSITIDCNGLDMNEYYTIYAVSSSDVGCVGKVKSLTVLTSDDKDPEIESVDIIGTTVKITFSESVCNLIPDFVTLKYYAEFSEGFGKDQPIATIPGSKLSIKVSDTFMTIPFDQIPAGAHFAICLEEGAVEDLVGNPSIAYASGYKKDEATGTVEPYGLLTGRKDNAFFNLDIYGGTPVTVVSNLAEPIWMSVPEGCQIVDADYSVAGSIIYVVEEDGHMSYDSYVTHGGAPTFDYGWNSTYGCALAYPNAGEQYTGRPDPKRGARITITIPSFLTDSYGNMNAEFEIGPFLYSYGYTLEDVIGTYVFDAESYYDGPMSGACVIEASDDPSQGNVMFTTIFDVPCDPGLAVYATFDPDAGTLTIADWQAFSYAAAYDGYWMFAINGEDFVVLNMPKSGTLVDTGVWFGYYLNSEAASGWGDIFMSFSAEKAVGAAAAPASARSIKLHESPRVIR